MVDKPNKAESITSPETTTTDEQDYPPVVKRKAKEPKQGEFDIVKQLQDICYNIDPNDIYRDMVKIGQG